MLLKLFFRCNVILFQFFGIFPCYYDDVNRRWRSNSFIKIYSFLVFVFQLLAFLIGAYGVANDITKSNPSRTIFISSIIACAFLIFDLVALYTQQLKNIDLFIKFANGFQLIYVKIRSSCDQSDYRPLLRIAVKLTSNNILNCIVTIIEIKRISSLSSVLQNYILYRFLYFCPNVVLMMLPSMFYCVELLLEHTIKQLNSILIRIVSDSSLLNDNKEFAQWKIKTMRQSCDLSDRIESLMILYSCLNKSTKTLNKAFNVQLLASNCCSVASLICKLYLEFYMITKMTSSNYLEIILNSLNGCFNQLLFIYVTYLVAGTSSNISKEVRIFEMDFSC